MFHPCIREARGYTNNRSRKCPNQLRSLSCRLYKMMLTACSSQLSARPGLARNGKTARPLLRSPVIPGPGLRTSIVVRTGSDPGVPYAGSRYNTSTGGSGGSNIGGGYGGSSGGGGGNFGGKNAVLSIIASILFMLPTYTA